MQETSERFYDRARSSALLDKWMICRPIFVKYPHVIRYCEKKTADNDPKRARYFRIQLSSASMLRHHENLTATAPPAIRTVTTHHIQFPLFFTISVQKISSSPAPNSGKCPRGRTMPRWTLVLCTCLVGCRNAQVPH
jgi:hypothetical protein